LLEVEPEKTSRLSKKVKIPMHPALIEELEKLRSDDEFALPAMARRYKIRHFQSEFAELLVKCGIADNQEGMVGFHSLRHTFVTRLEETGAGRSVAQKLVGHGSPVMTELYSHDLESARKAISHLPALKG
jgi:integrase